MDTFTTNPTDPRPDLAEDSALWTRLLTLAARNYPALIDSLLTMRQGSTVLKRLDTNVYALRPLIGKRGWPDEAAYKAKAAELLRPHHEQLVELLQVFAVWIEAELKYGNQGSRIRGHLDINGYCAIKSGVLGGEVIYFARDAKAADGVPGSAVTYTLDELRVLVDKPPGDEGLKRLHFAKKTFEGVIAV